MEWTCSGCDVCMRSVLLETAGMCILNMIAMLINDIFINGPSSFPVTTLIV